MKNLTLALTAILAALNLPTPVRAQQAAPSFDRTVEQLDGLFQKASANGGAYILSYRLGDRRISRVYGFLDCARTTPMPADALFDGGSLTKLFTSAAIFKLVEDRKLKLDDRLGEVFPGLPADKRNITIAQLLAHRSGIPNFLDPKGGDLPQRAWNVDTYDYALVDKAELLRRVGLAQLRFPPGTQEEYSNTGFVLLAAVIEKTSNEPYETFVQRRVFMPLGMHSTGYLMFDRGRHPIAQQCADGSNWGDPLTKGMWRHGVSWNLVGAGGMMTTIDDLDRWNGALERGTLFRADLQQRFTASYFGPSYRCRTLSAAVGGSNGMTRSLILHRPLKRESMISVGTHKEHGLPREEDMITILCGK